MPPKVNLTILLGIIITIVLSFGICEASGRGGGAGGHTSR